MIGGLLSKLLGGATGGAGKASIVLGSGKPIPVQFNPETYTLSTSATLVKGAEKPQFTELKREDFTIELLFDSYETKADVRQLPGFQEILKTIKPDIPTPSDAVPTECTFIWGPEDVYKGIIISIKQNFTLFHRDGTPLRCKMTVTIKNKIDTKQSEIDKGKNKCRKVRTIQQGERLDLLASRTLHNPYLWRELVNENPEIITNPRNYPLEEHLGKKLIIPDYYDAVGEKSV